MSSQNLEERITEPYTDDPSVRYLGTIQGCPLLWDDRAHQPWWPEGEPARVRYDTDGGITIDEQCDVNRVPPWVRQPKPLACGHPVRPGDAYVTWLERDEDTCLACAQTQGVSHDD